VGALLRTITTTYREEHDMPTMTYGPGFLEEARKSRNLTRKAFAELLKISVSSVINWEKNGVPERKASLVKRGLQIHDAREASKPRETEPLKEEQFTDPNAGPVVMVRISLDMFSTQELLAELQAREAAR